MKPLVAFAALLAGCATGETDRVSLKEELKREILSELREAPPGPAPKPSLTGSVEGRMVLGGRGVAECHVKVVRLLESDTFLGMFNEARLGTEFEASTDAEGRFVFRDLPVGRYRFLWQTPQDPAWTRRLRENPDAVVEAGKIVRVPDVELGRRAIGTASK